MNSFPNIAPADIELDKANDPENSILLKWIIFLLAYFQTRFSISDKALHWLLVFLRLLLKILGRSSPKIERLSEQMPRTVYSHQKRFGHFSGQGDKFQKFAVCKQCHTLYTLDHCSTKVGTRVIVNRCQHKDLSPRICGEMLMKRVVSCNGKERLYPHSFFCLSSIRQA